MEKFPQIPQLIFNGLQQLQNIGDLAPEVRKTAQQLQVRSAQASRRYWLAGSLFIAAIALAHPSIYEAVSAQVHGLNFSTASFVIAGLGLVALVIKKS
jgi:ubiquinone biosynthesis protein